MKKLGIIILTTAVLYLIALVITNTIIAVPIQLAVILLSNWILSNLKHRTDIHCVKEIAVYFKDTKFEAFQEFYTFSVDHHLRDKKYDIFRQDYTMLVGILNDFFMRKTGWSCGVTNEDIKKSIDQL